MAKAKHKSTHPSSKIFHPALLVTIHIQYCNRKVLLQYKW